MASTPDSRSLQKVSGSLAPPGNRQPMPTMAMGSEFEETEGPDEEPTVV
jgi:hypothetical protein